jgi:beta-glucoside operon transcriptional antiterminator
MRVCAFVFVCAIRFFYLYQKGQSMVVVKNINNNVSLCLDSRGKEVVVFGKGVGFIKPPAEVPLCKVERTFYDLNRQYIPLLAEIPSDVIDFTARQFASIQESLPYNTSSNLILTLADHLAFAMERARKGIHPPMPSLYELEASYPLEVSIGRKFVTAMEQTFHISLPRGEVQGVAMHFINARANDRASAPDPQAESLETRYDEILERTCQIIEYEMGVVICKDTFNYARFASHLQYLLRRIFADESIDSANIQMYHSIRDEYPQVSHCVDSIAAYLKSNWNACLTEEEKLYLIMHVNRVYSQEQKPDA